MSCDSTTSPIDKLNNSPNVQSITISPQEFSFTQADGFKDTTLSIQIDAIIENVDDSIIPGFVIRNKLSSAFISNGDLTAGDVANSFSISTTLESTTTSFDEYIVEVYAYNDNASGNFVQSTISIQGFANNRPEILDVSNPNEVVIPTTGVTEVAFMAKVSDLDGQDNIDRVLIEFINEDGSTLVPVPNELLDNGIDGDIAANDSVFTISFSINANNTPNNRRALYFAVDKAGLHSDTLETVFNIVEQ